MTTLTERLVSGLVTGVLSAAIGVGIGWYGKAAANNQAIVTAMSAVAQVRSEATLADSKITADQAVLHTQMDDTKQQVRDLIAALHETNAKLDALIATELRIHGSRQ